MARNGVRIVLHHWNGCVCFSLLFALAVFFVHLLYFTRSTYHTFCFCVLSRFTLLYHGYFVEHLHGVQFSCIVSSQFTNEKHASVCCSICKRKLINSLFILIPLCSMLTSRAKHAYDFKIVETHALIAIQFDWKREKEKKEQNEHKYNEKLNANRLTYAKMVNRKWELQLRDKAQRRTRKTRRRLR